MNSSKCAAHLAQARLISAWRWRVWPSSNKRLQSSTLTPVTTSIMRTWTKSFATTLRQVTPKRNQRRLNKLSVVSESLRFSTSKSCSFFSRWSSPKSTGSRCRSTSASSSSTVFRVCSPQWHRTSSTTSNWWKRSSTSSKVWQRGITLEWSTLTTRRMRTRFKGSLISRISSTSRSRGQSISKYSPIRCQMARPTMSYSSTDYFWP